MDFLGYSKQAFGWIVFATTITFVIGTLYNIIVIKSKGPAQIVFQGCATALIGITASTGLAFFKIYSLALMLPALAVFMLGAGAVLPAAKAGAMTVFHSHSGKAASFMKFIQTTLCVLVTAIASHLHSTISIVTIMGLLAATILSALVIFVNLN